MGSVNSKITIAARILLGLPFAVFGANGFLHFLPMPPLTGAAGAFLGALAATGYMLPLIAGTEFIAGLLLLQGRLTALALLLLAPVLVNIVAYHVFLAPASLGLPLALCLLELYLAWSYRGVFTPLLRPSRPASANEETRGLAGAAVR